MLVLHGCITSSSLKLLLMISSLIVIHGLFHLLQVRGMLMTHNLCVVVIATERADISTVVLEFVIIVMLCS